MAFPDPPPPPRSLVFHFARIHWSKTLFSCRIANRKPLHSMAIESSWNSRFSFATNSYFAPHCCILRRLITTYGRLRFSPEGTNFNLNLKIYCHIWFVWRIRNNKLNVIYFVQYVQAHSTIVQVHLFLYFLMLLLQPARVVEAREDRIMFVVTEDCLPHSRL